MNCVSEQIPEPGADAIAHSNKLRQYLLDIIAEQGSIPFSRYMHEVLYRPGLGYYAAGSRKFGVEGDFVTAPEISSLFAECLASQAVQILNLVGGDILELGAGSGRLALDLMRSLERQDQLPERYFILEPSAELQHRQKQGFHENLPQLAERVVWLDALPESFTGFIFGNEVLDAFPAERFTVDAGEIKQLGVSAEGSQLVTKEITADPILVSAVRHIESENGIKLPNGYVSELSLLQQDWIAAMSASLTVGAIVLLDYGYPRREYYLPERSQGTLRCYYRHRAHENPFLWPGLQDITCHVDFTALVSNAVDAELVFEGFTSQAQFLLATHLLEHAENSKADTALVRGKLSHEIRQLTMPGAMGDSFNAVAFSRGIDDIMLGFSGTDHSHRL